MDAIILAGGLGTRLRSVVSEVPKCMAPVAARPFLYYLLVSLKRYSEVERVVLSVGYLREVIFDWIEQVKGEFPFQISYAVEETPLGTGGGIRLALDCCESDDVLVLNGDTMFDFDMRPFLAYHRSEPLAAITLALKRMENFDRYGTVVTDAQGRVTAFREKQPCAVGNINGGIYLIRRSKLDLSQLPEKFSFEKEVFEPHVEMGDLRGYEVDSQADEEHRPYFIDIGIPEDYRLSQFQFLCRYDDTPHPRTLLLDRDGTINVLRPNDYVKCWEEFEFLPDFLATAAALAQHFDKIFVVTNQRGIGKGLMSESDLQDIHEKMMAELQKVGGRIDDIFYCTGLSADDPCRKPQLGMWHQILSRYPETSASHAVMVGDGDVDEQFAKNAGIRFVRV